MKKYYTIATVITLSTLLAAFNSGGKLFEISKSLDIFATLFKEINIYYVDDIEPEALIKTGMEAMLESLDPYTNYISEEDIDDYRTMTTGQFGGINAIVGYQNNKNVIVAFEGVNNETNKGGLEIGDEVVEIDGVDVRDKSFYAVGKLLRGQVNTNLKVKVKRYGVKDAITLSLKRDKISINNVPYFGLIKPTIGYIRLTDFTTGASREVKSAMLKLKSQGADKLIIDLRDNPGGLLNEAVNISNLFIPKGAEVVSTNGRMTEWNKMYSALDNPVDIEIPIAILTSNMSASAAEIVAGVIQDYDRGILVGQKTFGKGLVQATRPLSYNTQLKITTAKYYTPSGRCIQALDYAHRNEDGSVGKIADSLISSFKTKNGRIVYDGGGIDPDILVEREEYAPIIQKLIGKGYLFDYATIYKYKKPTIKPAYNFTLTDEEYKEFLVWLQDKDLEYTTRIEEKLDDLTSVSIKEKVHEDIHPELNALKLKVQHNKNDDLQRFKNEIKEILEAEIAKRYYLRKGEMESYFDHDKVILEAVNVLSDNSRYQKIINPVKGGKP